jgi:hypothetical protein
LSCCAFRKAGERKQKRGKRKEDRGNRKEENAPHMPFVLFSILFSISSFLLLSRLIGSTAYPLLLV